MVQRSSPNPTSKDELEALAREMTHDAIAAARVGWRLASRVGRFGLRVAERASEEFEKALQ